MKILIDNGHGNNTSGKRSPDGKFLEAIYTREIAKKLQTDLIDRGYDAELITPEDDDIPLPASSEIIIKHVLSSMIPPCSSYAKYAP